MDLFKYLDHNDFSLNCVSNNMGNYTIRMIPPLSEFNESTFGKMHLTVIPIMDSLNDSHERFI